MPRLSDSSVPFVNQSLALALILWHNNATLTLINLYEFHIRAVTVELTCHDLNMFMLIFHELP